VLILPGCHRVTPCGSKIIRVSHWPDESWGSHSGCHGDKTFGCRAFCYQATKELGGHRFKSRSEATAWIFKNFIKSCPHTAASPAEHKTSDRSTTSFQDTDLCARNLDIGGACIDERREPATFACDVDLLHWAVDQPSRETLAWAAEAASQLNEHMQGAMNHTERHYRLEEQLPKLNQWLAELASPRVRFSTDCAGCMPPPCGIHPELCAPMIRATNYIDQKAN
jgi:hypothetical protein